MNAHVSLAKPAQGLLLDLSQYGFIPGPNFFYCGDCLDTQPHLGSTQASRCVAHALVAHGRDQELQQTLQSDIELELTTCSLAATPSVRAGQSLLVCLVAGATIWGTIVGYLFS